MRKRVPTYIVLLLIIFGIFSLDLTRRYLAGEFEDEKLEIEFLYSSEKAGWLETVIPIYEKQYQDTTGKSINIIATPIGTGKGTNQVAAEASKPIVWSPASRFWLPILNFLWSTNHETDIVDVTSPSLVVSPTIIATWRSYQETNNITGLESLRQLSLDDPSFTFAHTDPFESNSGFGAVIMEAAVAANKNPEELTLDDLALESVQNWMRDLEGSAIQYGSSTGFLGKLMANEGPDKLKVAIIYENLVLEKNKQLTDDKLVAIYPKEGTVLNDHPYAILNAPWVSQLDRELATDFVNFLRSSEIQRLAIDIGFRPSVDIGLSTEINEVFTDEAGVKSSLDGVKIYELGNLNGEILQRIPDLWTATRSRSLGSNSIESQNLTASDFFVPAIIFTLYLSMLLSPVISKIRRDYL